ncbi:GGDEF domain-containing protein [Actinoplanes awajinensis]|uniref:GGDEF domain-containing protein n=1 Tax=Actinoplanes awajinensis subsp. mycoplanecinus TaxID=135947 RepID=A0A101JQD7_9ACTN|nr:GGDEF domain-containing protein [Actinoplanes awajinensis]KUL31258.1 hypothetical protein ADL15_22680 [Actinoplanes awajinensis subsp. mycoplanecinus]
MDHFKAINDRYSHGVGDRVPGEIAAVLRSHCRHDEVAIRFGGDEFAVFLAVGEEEARQIAERIRRVILARDWSTIMPGLTVTLSMGLAACRAGIFTTGRTPTSTSPSAAAATGWPRTPLPEHRVVRGEERLAPDVTYSHVRGVHPFSRYRRPGPS